MVLAFALVVSARPQDYDDYDQPAHRQHQKPHSQNQKRNEDRETSTYIPIIQYDKEQEINGNYKTQ